jgi:pimeloyl-ACP methyl ester carboxylesterase
MRKMTDTSMSPTMAAALIPAVLTASDGTSISAGHLPHEGDLCLVVAHGFTGQWRSERVEKVIRVLSTSAGVIVLDMRGHGESGGVTTIGHKEIQDVSAAVAWARELGYRYVVTVGFSMGGAVVLRQAAFPEGESDHVDAVIAVSAPAFWHYRGTKIMRRMHAVVASKAGRTFMRTRGTRIDSQGWPDPMPAAPVEAISLYPHLAVLIVHGDIDRYFPLEHPRALHAAAVAGGNENVQLWEISGFGHAESAIDDETLERIVGWAREQITRVEG